MPQQSAATSNLAVQGDRGRVNGIPGPDVPFQVQNPNVASGMPYRTGSPERDERFKEAMGLPTGRPAYTDATRPAPMTSANPTVRNRAVAGPARTAAQAPPQQGLQTSAPAPATYTNNWQRPAAAPTPGMSPYSAPIEQLSETDPNRAISAIMAARGGLRG
jgi:hypothetical protein